MLKTAKSMDHATCSRWTWTQERFWPPQNENREDKIGMTPAGDPRIEGQNMVKSRLTNIRRPHAHVRDARGPTGPHVCEKW